MRAQYDLEILNDNLNYMIENSLVSEKKDSIYRKLNKWVQQWMFIYKIVNIQNDKVYIGSTGDVDPIGRLKRHLHELTTNQHCNFHLQRAFNKYGRDSFVFQVIELIPRENSLAESTRKREEREQWYIDTLEACNEDKGYNEAEHAHGGFNFCTWDTVFERTGLEPKYLRQYIDLLENTDLTFVEIDKEVGLGRHLAYKIYYKYSFRKITEGCNFKPRNPRDSVKGEKSTSSKLKNSDVQEIIQLLLQTDPQVEIPEIAEKYNVSRATVWDIYKKRNWKHLTKDIEFPERTGRRK